MGDDYLWNTSSGNDYGWAEMSNNSTYVSYGREGRISVAIPEHPLDLGGSILTDESIMLLSTAHGAGEHSEMKYPASCPMCWEERYG